MTLLHQDDVDRTMPTFEEWTPLHYACDSNMVEEVEFLFQNPYVDVNAADLRNGCTPLHYVCGWCAIPIVKRCSGVTTSCVDERLKTPWERRPKKQHEEAFNKRIEELEQILKARGAHGNLKALSIKTRTCYLCYINVSRLWMDDLLQNGQFLL